MTHSDGRAAFFCDVGGGYSNSVPWAEYICATATEAEALSRLGTLGFVTVDDLRARWDGWIRTQVASTD